MEHPVLTLTPFELKSTGPEQKKEPEFPFECKGGVCPIKPKDQKTVAGSGDPHAVGKEEVTAAEEKKLI